MAKNTYLGNPNLKAAGVKVDFTRDQVDEYLKCAADPEYFIVKYMKIVHVDRGLINFDMYPYQRRMITAFHKKRFIITKMPRQSGKSTAVVSYMLWLILFTDNQSVAILANKGSLARDMLAKIKLAYEYIPKWMQQGVVTWNKGNLELENGSKILAAATSSTAVRGGSYNCILLDEFAFVQRNIAETFFSSVYPTISSGSTTQIIIVSTPCGMNHYYKMWSDAIHGRNLYEPIEVDWRDTPGRDDKFREETIRNTSIEQWRQEFECEFIGSTNTLIAAKKLREMAYVDPVRKTDDGVCIHEEPIPGRTYVTVVDTSRGLELDDSAFSVIDVTDVPYKLAAKYNNNSIPTTIYPDLVVKYCILYNNAYVLIETNDVGKQVADTIYMELEYENILSSVVKGRRGARAGEWTTSKSILGVMTSTVVKRVGCTNLKDLIEDDKLIVPDFDIISQLSTFVVDRRTYKAEDGCKDDLVMTLVLFGWLTRQEYFKDLTNTDYRKKMILERSATDEAAELPVGFVDDGRQAEPEALSGELSASRYQDGFGFHQENF